MNFAPRTAATPPQNLDRIVVSACRIAGIDARSVKLLRHFGNAVYLVHDHRPVVARVAYNAGVTQRSRTAVSATRWLSSQKFPATTPIELPSGHPQPVVSSEAPTEIAVTFWSYYPQPRNSPTPDIKEVATLARKLHDITDLPPIPLPTYEPLRTLRRDVASSNLDRERLTWLTDQIEQVCDEYARLDFPLGTGLIHGDMYAGNLLVDQAHASYILGDWDSVCIGPREIDLAPTFAAARFGLDGPSLARFAAQYGYDLRGWAGYPTLRFIRELSTLTALMRLAPVKPAADRELRHRIDTLRDLDQAIWQAQ